MATGAKEKIDPLVGRTIGDYRLLSKIGSGGMGDVYRAHEEKLDRIVALKVLKLLGAEDEVHIKRFYREARAGAQLSHPNIVTVYNVGCAAERHFIAMEYIEGTDLSTILKRDERIDFRRALAIARQIASALQAAHERGIVHRDIKPHNIIIDRRGNVKVSDFGIARIATEVHAGLTQAGEMVGTILYMSPEQARGEEVDFRTDIYSLGVVLYEAVAGRPPFTAPSPGAVVFKVLNEEPTPMLRARPTTPPQVAQLVHQAMARNPADRFRSAAEMEREIVSLIRLFAPETLESNAVELDFGNDTVPPLDDLDMPESAPRPDPLRSSRAGGGHTRTEFSLTVPGGEVSRKEYLLVVLQNNMDFKVITGPLVQEVADLIQKANEEELQPLLDQLDKLETEGPAYAPSFADWWKNWTAKPIPGKGPVDTGSDSGPERGLVRQAVGLLTGIGGRVSEGEGVAVLSREELRRDPLALMWLARCHFEGRAGFRRDPSHARKMALAAGGKLSELANDKRDPEAAFILGYALAEGIGSPKNERRAADLYRMSAEAGYAPAMGKLGTMYKDGTGVDRDDRLAIEWYRKAADAGDAASMHNLAWMYKEGRGVPTNEATAVTWYRKAATLGYSPSMNNLAFMYRKGLGVEKNPDEAIHWLRKGVEAGNASAMNNLAVLYEDGRGVPKDVAEAERLRRMAADLGDSTAIRALGSMYRKGDGSLEDSFKMYLKGAESGDINSMYAVARLYENGEGVAKDREKAEMWYAKCGERKHPGALYRLGKLRQKASGSLQDMSAAADWFQKAADLGEVRAAMELAHMYEQGTGVAKDIAAAAKYFRVAADAGDTEAMHTLAWLYETGQLGKPDLEQASFWYRRAADAGYAVSMNRVAWMYENGAGLPKNRAKAIEWYEKAADYGISLARNQAERLRAER